jgi:DNA-binding transcriptional LysR family regulator
MPAARNVLTPENLSMLQSIIEKGSFAAAARDMGVVPSALTYRVRQLEDALDVLLFDRTSRQAIATSAGLELLQEGKKILLAADALTHKIKRIATGWESQLTICVDGAISRHTVMELTAAFYTMQPPTRIKLIDGILAGTLEAVTTGKADIAIGSAMTTHNSTYNMPGMQHELLGEVTFVLTVAPYHPLASQIEPLSDDTLEQYRLIAVADSAQIQPITIGVITGQDTLTVDSMDAKLQALLHGLGCGFLPEPMVRPYLQSGQLVAKTVARPERRIPLHYAWGGPAFSQPGKAMQWWLEQLQSTPTRLALLESHYPNSSSNLIVKHNK